MLEMTKPSYRRNAQLAGVLNRSSGCMAMVNVRIVIKMLCRVVMGLCVKIFHSVFLVVAKERQFDGAQISAFYLYENKNAL